MIAALVTFADLDTARSEVPALLEPTVAVVVLEALERRDCPCRPAPWFLIAAQGVRVGVVHADHPEHVRPSPRFAVLDLRGGAQA